jgi:tetratricopeptide (TPR) repeat protein
MDEQSPEFQHIRVDELQERDLYQDQHYDQDHDQDHHHQHQHQHRGIYDVYTTQNNLGVMLLREKRYLDAANCFCKAVKYVNERSMYHCPRHGDARNCNNNNNNNGLYCDHNDAYQNHDQSQNQSQSPVSPTQQSSVSSNENDDFDEFDAASSISSSFGAETHVGSSSSNIIDSFYLLLDEDNRDQKSSSSSRSNDDTGSHQASHQNSSYTRCDDRSPPSLSSSYSGDNSNNGSSSTPPASSSSSSSQTDEETYMFKNPIIVSERGVDPSWSRNFLTHETSESAPNHAAAAANGYSMTPTTSTTASTSTTTLTTTTTTATPAQAPTTRTNTSPVVTIDKKSCAKLSLVSVYNMALTYHLAALDNKDNNNNKNNIHNRETETAGSSNFLDNRPNRTTTTTNIDDAVVTVNPDVYSSSDLRTTHIPASSSNARPTKRQRLSNCSCNENEDNNNTTMTPFGECNNPYHHVNRDGFSNSNHPMARNTTTGVLSNTTTVDRVLLSQALAYYEIAYRILMSEQRVLVSHAMVILNNIGHIHRLMGKEENAKRCFQRLLTTMIYLQQTGDSHQISHWDCFLTNVIDLMVSQEHSHKKFAPAA